MNCFRLSLNSRNCRMPGSKSERPTSVGLASGCDRFAPPRGSVISVQSIVKDRREAGPDASAVGYPVVRARRGISLVPVTQETFERVVAAFRCFTQQRAQWLRPQIHAEVWRHET